MVCSSRCQKIRHLVTSLGSLLHNVTLLDPPALAPAATDFTSARNQAVQPSFHTTRTWLRQYRRSLFSMVMAAASDPSDPMRPHPLLLLQRCVHGFTNESRAVIQFIQALYIFRVKPHSNWLICHLPSVWSKAATGWDVISRELRF